MSRRTTYGLLAITALLYLFLGWRYTVQTPRWQVPDEPAHYNYIRQLAENQRFPVIEMGDWDSEYQQQLLDSGFDPQVTGEIHRIEYEDHQPPLYYIVGAIFYRLSDGDLTTLRLYSLLLGLGAVLAAFFVVNQLFPAPIALITAAVVAFIPQNLSMLSGVNNDAMAELVAGWTFYTIVWYLRQDGEARLRDVIFPGVMVGIAMLTKNTIYFVAGIAVLAILLKARRMGWNWQTGAKQLIVFLIPALLMGSLWWVRNLDVYGGTDFLGLQRHDEVAAGQLQTDDYIRNHLNGSKTQYFKNMVDETFHSFWGQFGWMAVPMATRVYRILLLVCIAALTGIVIHAWREHWIKSLDSVQRETLLLFVLSMLLVLAAYILYNLQFKQFQGRYLYPALIPFAFWLAVGITGWTNLAAIRFAPLRWGFVPMILVMAIFAWYALHTYIGTLPNPQ